jgi:hypothetical protein
MAGRFHFLFFFLLVGGFLCTVSLPVIAVLFISKVVNHDPGRIAWKLYLVQRLKTKRRLMAGAERGGTGSWRGAVVLHEYN